MIEDAALFFGKGRRFFAFYGKTASAITDKGGRRTRHFPRWRRTSGRFPPEIDPPPFTWRGETYTRYAATQKMRQMEEQMRAYKRQLIANEASGNEKKYARYKLKLQKKSRAYKDFCRAADLRPQPVRARVEGFGPREAAKARRT